MVGDTARLSAMCCCSKAVSLGSVPKAPPPGWTMEPGQYPGQDGEAGQAVQTDGIQPTGQDGEAAGTQPIGQDGEAGQAAQADGTQPTGQVDEAGQAGQAAQAGRVNEAGESEQLAVLKGIQQSLNDLAMNMYSIWEGQTDQLNALRAVLRELQYLKHDTARLVEIANHLADAAPAPQADAAPPAEPAVPAGPTAAPIALSGVWGCAHCRWAPSGCATCNPEKAAVYAAKKKGEVEDDCGELAALCLPPAKCRRKG